ncbi:MAG: SdrD B-like domain-containing protein [Pseudomonadota bacterium]
MTYKTFEFTAFSEAELDVGNVKSGTTFKMPTASLCISVKDNDPFLSGDSHKNENANDKHGQTASIDDRAGNDVGNGGQIYAEQWFWVKDQNGHRYKMIEIEQEGDGQDYFTFYNGDGHGTPPPGAELTVMERSNVTNDKWLDYKCLDAGAKNEAPDAKNDCITVYEDESGGDLDGNVLSNDTDADGDPLHVSGVDGRSSNVGKWIHLDKGKVKITKDGRIDFDADGDFDYLKEGEITKVVVKYDISDGNGGSDWAKVTIKVEGKANPGSIKGRLTKDADCNDNEWNDDTGTWDEGIAGAKIELFDGDGNFVAETLTDAHGAYVFDVPPGDYKVKFPKPDGYAFSQKDSGVDEHYDSDANPDGFTDPIHVGEGQTVHNVDAGLKLAVGSISGRVFCDTNCDGLDETTTVVEGCDYTIEAEDMHKWNFQTVHGKKASGGELARLKKAGGDGDLWTDFDGKTGTYDLTVFVQDENDGRSEIIVKVDGKQVGKIKLDRDGDGGGSNNGGFSQFTIEDLPIEAGDKIQLWVDGDHGEFVRIDKIELKGADQTIVEEEPGKEGVEVRLLTRELEPVLDEAGNPITTITAADGSYSFDNVPEGEYQVQFVNPDGTVFTAKDVGDDDTIDSDAGEFGLTDVITVAAGDKIKDVDAGLKEEPIVTEPCTFKLLNHPDGAEAAPFYGLRLDNVFDTGVYTFDFEAEGAAMFVTVDGSTIHIYGTAVGGRDIGSSYESTSLFQIDFTYDMVEQAFGDNDLVVTAAKQGDGTGTISQLDADGNVVDTKTLTDKAGDNPFSFRFGDTDDDQGHRGFDGKSGWGWLLVDGQDPAGAQDWLFAVGPKVEPPICIKENTTYVTDLDLTIDCPDKGTTIGEPDLVYEISGGADAALFQIDPVSGRLTFIDAPDFENPTDAGLDGTYEVTVRASAGAEPQTVTANFSADALGSALAAGDGPVLALDGVTFTAIRSQDTDGVFNDAMIFDAANPTGQDGDLGQAAQGNVLIISEDGDASDPDDEAHGGTIEATFDTPSTVQSIVVLDTEEAGGTIDLFDVDGNTIATFVIPSIPNGTLQTIDFGDVAGVASMTITLKGSGAIDDLVFVREGEAKSVEKHISVEVKDVDETGTLTGRYFIDANDDSRDGGIGVEAGVAGVTIALVTAAGAPTGLTAITDGDGVYTFADVPSGTYKVQFPPDPGGFVFVEQDVGGNAFDADDSDVDATGLTGEVTIPPGGILENVDAGIEDPMTGQISGRYFCDLDNSNTETQGDIGIVDAIIELQLEVQQGVWQTVDTFSLAAQGEENDGVYSFTGLAQGTYRVGFTPETGKAFIPPGQGDESTDSDVVAELANGLGITDPIQINPGSDVQDVDAGVARDPSFTLGGSIITERDATQSITIIMDYSPSTYGTLGDVDPFFFAGLDDLNNDGQQTVIDDMLAQIVDRAATLSPDQPVHLILAGETSVIGTMTPTAGEILAERDAGTLPQFFEGLFNPSTPAPGEFNVAAALQAAGDYLISFGVPKGADVDDIVILTTDDAFSGGPGDGGGVGGPGSFFVNGEDPSPIVSFLTDPSGFDANINVVALDGSQAFTSLVLDSVDDDGMIDVITPGQSFMLDTLISSPPDTASNGTVVEFVVTITTNGTPTLVPGIDASDLTFDAAAGAFVFADTQIDLPSEPGVVDVFVGVDGDDADTAADQFFNLSNVLTELERTVSNGDTLSFVIDTFENQIIGG